MKQPLYKTIDETLVVYKNAQDIHEGFKSFMHAGLDAAGVAGDMFFGIGGAPFDIANGLWYLKDGEYLFAALSFISAIPVIGDIVGKGGKIAIVAEKAASRLPKTASAFRVSAQTIAKTKEVIHANKGVIDKVFDKIDQQPKPGQKDLFASIRPYASKMKQALDIYAGRSSGAPTGAAASDPMDTSFI